MLKDFDWKKWGGWALALVLLLLLSFQTYSKKKVKEEFDSYKSSHNQTEKIKEPVLVGGKIVYRYIDRVIHDTVDASKTKKETTIWKSSVAVGVLFDLSTFQPKGGYLAPDVLGIGPGAIGLNLTILQPAFYGGIQYRINF